MYSILNNFLIYMLLFFCFPNTILTSSFTSTRPLCHMDESIALLKFKQSLTIDESASSDPSAYNKIDSWKFEGENISNCCSWNGIECENKTGNVIGLELKSSFLFGSVNLTTLFALVHLQRLDLSDNNFNHSHIPSEIGSLSRLTVLDLSQSNFFGNIPQEVSKLSKLVSLRVSEDKNFSSSSGLLKLENHTLSGLLQNLTRLKELDLSWVDLSSKAPDILANLSSLETLNLNGCNLYGEFPMSIFHLPKLRILDVSMNRNLSGCLPEFNRNNHLETLSLDSCNFSGTIPASVGNLSQLTRLNLGSNSLSGRVPNLGSLSKLNILAIFNNRVNVDSLIWIQNLTALTALYLDGIDLSSSILSIHPKNYHSAFPGLVSNNTLPNFKILELESCNLKGFPDFLRYQDELDVLNLGNNDIYGRVPIWFTNISKESLAGLNLYQNLLTGFDQKQEFLPWHDIEYVSFIDNMMEGPLPIPPPSIIAYGVNKNNFSGKISSLLCNSSTLQILELSDNSLEGTIPPCFSNLSRSLSILKLGGNNLHGPIPQTFKEGNTLKLIDLSRNKLTGKVPRSLEKCKSLRSLDLSNNLLEDVFPFWLGSLPVLQIMLLGSNKLHGDIANPKSELDFPKLHICDLSCNNFTGHLPGEYFRTWGGMRSPKSEEDEYMVESTEFHVHNNKWSVGIAYSMAFTSKGVNTNYTKIMNIFAAIDLSSNQFEGEIPEVLGTLQGIELLNLSNNGLIGKIPSSLGNLSKLESLDISRNKLSGKIPQQLVMLTFLEVLNVSENNLTGPIPKGKQFDTFQSNSYEGNLGLCGNPLLRKCENVEVPMLTPPPLTLDGDGDDSDFPSGFDWVMIGVGVVFGLTVSLVIGHFLCDPFETIVREKLKSKGRQRKGRN